MLSDLLNRNYKQIKVCARKISGNKADDVINETYLTLSNKKPPVNDFEFVKWFTKTMDNNYKLRNSDFNKRYRSKELVCEEVPEQIENIDLDIFAEEINEETKELIEVASYMRRDRALLYLDVLDFKNTLPLHEKYLFEVYFEHGLSTREISEMESKLSGYDFGYQRVNQMVNEIKKKIKLKWNL